MRNRIIMQKLKAVIDFIALAAGIAALTCILFFPSGRVWSENLCIAAGITGAGYLAYAVFLFFFRKIEFDRKLICGNFLRKVICIVLLLPFTLTLVIGIFVSDPKEIAYEESLYGLDDDGVETLRERQTSPGLFWSVYFHFVDPGNQHMSSTRTGRGIAGLAAILGIFLLNGLLVSSIIGFTDRRKSWRENGQTRYRVGDLGKNRFAVIIGANEIAASVIKNLLTPRSGHSDINFKCEGDNRYIILMTSTDAGQARNELEAHLTDEELDKVIIYNASRESKAEIGKLHLKHATEIYVLGESTARDGGESGHDALNMKCVNLIAENLEGSHRKVCKVLFEYQTTYSVFQFSDIPETVSKNLVFIPFNRYESWARKVMVECRAMADSSDKFPICYTPLDGNGLHENSEKFVHFIIVGMSKMGMAMGIEALQQAHYLNFRKRRTRLTFIDTEADREMAFFKGRYENLFSLVRHRYIDAANCPEELLDSDYGSVDPMALPGCKWKHLSEDGTNFTDIDIEFVKGAIESEGIRSYLRRISADKDSVLTIAVCLPQTHISVAASLYMPIEVYEKAQQIWVYQSDSADIISNLNDTPQKDRRYKMLRPFGMDYGEYLCDRTLYLKALLVNAAYEMNGKEIDLSKEETYADLRASWRALSIDKKFSNEFFVDSIYQKIRGILPAASGCITGVGDMPSFKEGDSLGKLLDANRDILARCEHNRWNMQQLLFGYMPCNEEQDKIFERLNSDLDKARAGGAKDEIDAAKAKMKAAKRQYKESEFRIHPNLCSYEHLDLVDSGARSYDIDINNSIPRLLELVDKKAAESVRKHDS